MDIFILNLSYEIFSAGDDSKSYTLGVFDTETALNDFIISFFGEFERLITCAQEFYKENPRMSVYFGCKNDNELQEQLKKNPIASITDVNKANFFFKETKNAFSLMVMQEKLVSHLESKGFNIKAWRTFFSKFQYQSLKFNVAHYTLNEFEVKDLQLYGALEP